MGLLIRPPQPVLVPVPLRPRAIRNISSNEWFGPLEPLRPTAPAGTQPRQLQFLPGQNLIWEPRADEPISFADLIYLADNCDLVRIVIEALKDQIVQRPWQIRVVAQPGETQKERTNRSLKDPRVAKWTSFFKWPNPDQIWSDWLRMLLEDVLVLDAPSILLQRNKKGDIGALRVIDGQTITRLIDANGFTPQPPYPAYQQVLYGMPAVDLTTDDLIYRPRNQRARKLYGFGPVEQVILTVNTTIRRQRFQLAYYTDGSVPEALYTMPASVTEDRIREFQQWFDMQMAGNLANRRRIWFIPGDDKGVNRLHFTKEALLKDDADEWFARIICFAFRISPKELIRVMNRASAAESQDSSEEMGVHVMCEWVADTVNYIIQKKAGDADIEFTFAQKREADVLKQAQADKIYVSEGIRTRNEVRDDLGDDPSQDPEADRLGVTTQQGFLPLDLAQKQVEAEVGRAGATPNEKRPATSNSGKAPDPEQNEGIKARKIAAGPFAERDSREFQEKIESFFAEAAAMAAQVVEDSVHKADDDDEPLPEDFHLEDLLDDIDGAIDWDDLVVAAENSLLASTASGASLAIGQNQVADIKLIANASDAAREYARKRAAEMVGKRWRNGKLVPNPDAKWRIDRTTRDELRGVIEKAFAERVHRRDLAEQIRHAAAFSKARAAMIAKTEITRAQSMGQIAVWKSIGTVTKVRWLAGGPNPCPECLANAAAGEVELGQPFPSGDVAPGAHPNCECALIPAL